MVKSFKQLEEFGSVKRQKEVEKIDKQIQHLQKSIETG